MTQSTTTCQCPHCQGHLCSECTCGPDCACPTCNHNICQCAHCDRQECRTCTCTSCTCPTCDHAA